MEMRRQLPVIVTGKIKRQQIAQHGFLLARLA
jgi:hypothetical protein